MSEPAFVDPESSDPSAVPLTLVESPPGASSTWPVATDGSSPIVVVAPTAAPIHRQALFVAGLAIGLGFLAGWVGWLAMAPSPSVPVTNVEVRAPAAVVAPDPDEIASSSAVPSLPAEVEECSEAGACAPETPPPARAESPPAPSVAVDV